MDGAITTSAAAAVRYTVSELQLDSELVLVGQSVQLFEQRKRCENSELFRTIQPKACGVEGRLRTGTWGIRGMAKKEIPVHF